MSEQIVGKFHLARGAAGQMIARWDGPGPVQLYYPSGGVPIYNTVIRPGETVSLWSLETSRNEEEDERFDRQWGRATRPLGGKGRKSNLTPGGADA